MKTIYLAVEVPEDFEKISYSEMKDRISINFMLDSESCVDPEFRIIPVPRPVAPQGEPIASVDKSAAGCISWRTGLLRADIEDGQKLYSSVPVAMVEPIAMQTLQDVYRLGFQRCAAYPNSSVYAGSATYRADMAKDLTPYAAQPLPAPTQQEVASTQQRTNDLTRATAAGFTHGIETGKAMVASASDVLFDGHAVYSALDAKAKRRTGAENVSDTLDAIVRLMRAQANEQAGHPAQLVNEHGELKR